MQTEASFKAHQARDKNSFLTGWPTVNVDFQKGVEIQGNVKQMK